MAVRANMSGHVRGPTSSWPCAIGFVGLPTDLPLICTPNISFPSLSPSPLNEFNERTRTIRCHHVVDWTSSILHF